MVIGEDPMNIEKIWQILYVGMMGHGMTGVVGSGAINGIEMALWDIKVRPSAHPYGTCWVARFGTVCACTGTRFATRWESTAARTA